jgi:hypothetical protein
VDGFQTEPGELQGRDLGSCGGHWRRGQEARSEILLHVLQDSVQCGLVSQGLSLSQGQAGHWQCLVNVMDKGVWEQAHARPSHLSTLLLPCLPPKGTTGTWDIACQCPEACCTLALSSSGDLGIQEGLYA